MVKVKSHQEPAAVTIIPLEPKETKLLISLADAMQSNCKSWISFLRRASEEINVVVAASSSTQDHPVRMEGCGRHGRASVLAEEARIRLNSGELFAVEIEHLDDVC